MNQKQIIRRKVRDFVLALLAFLIILKVSEYILSHTLSERVQSIAIFIFTIAPIIPAAAILFILLRVLQQSDELQQRIQLMAIAFAAGFIGLLTFTIGYLERLGLPSMPIICVLPLMLIFWMIGVVFFARKYR